MHDPSLRSTLVDLGNKLQATEGDLARFTEDDDDDAGYALLSALRDVAGELGSLIDDVERIVDDVCP